MIGGGDQTWANTRGWRTAGTVGRHAPCAAVAAPAVCPPVPDLPPAMVRPLYAQVNLAALARNLGAVRLRAPNTQVFAVVKANAYGHGLARVLPALADAEGLALLELDAAVELRALHYMR